MAKHITNVQVGCEITGRYSLSWEFGENARYHVWMDMDKNLSGGFGEEPELFKNPMVGPKQPGYYPTRRLDPKAVSNTWMIIQALNYANQHDLFGMSAKAKADKEAAEDAKREADHKRHRKQAVGHLAVDVLKLIDQATTGINAHFPAHLTTKLMAVIALAEREDIKDFQKWNEAMDAMTLGDL